MLDATEWKYVAEGNANVVFAYKGRDPRYTFKAIRFQKYKCNSISLQEQEVWRTTKLYPAIPALQPYLLPTELIEIAIRDLAVFDASLQAAARPTKYGHIMLAASHALIMPYLCSDQRHLILDFKPKWLTKEHKDKSRCCRTCALRHYRAQDRGIHGFCPLDLASMESMRVARAVGAIAQERGWDVDLQQIGAIVEFLSTDPILPRLCEAQTRLSQDIPMCMTMRDVSIYLILDREQNRVTKCYIADLDQKHPSKYDYWQSIERELRQGGWYDGKYCAAGVSN